MFQTYKSASFSFVGRIFFRLIGILVITLLFSCTVSQSPKFSVDDKESVIPTEKTEAAPADPKDQPPQSPKDSAGKPSSPVVLVKPLEVEIKCDEISENLRCSSSQKPFVKEFPAYSEIVLPIANQIWHFEIQSLLELTQEGIDRFSKTHKTLGNNPYVNTSLFLAETKFNEHLEKALLQLPEIYSKEFGKAYQHDVYLKVLSGVGNLERFAVDAGLKIKSFVLEFHPFESGNGE